MSVEIYGLFDPRTDELRYIGKTAISMAVRLRQHLQPKALNRYETYKNHWIKSLLAQHLKPLIRLIQVVHEVQWEEAEIYWIAYFKSVGCRLLNHTPGGDGNRKGTKMSEAAIKRSAEAHRGLKMPPRSPEWCRQRSETLRGRKNSDITRQKKSIGQTARWEKRRQDGSIDDHMAHTRRPIIDNLGTIYPGGAAAGRALGLAAGAICRVLKGRRPTAAGRTFRYLTAEEVSTLPELTRSVG